MALGLLILDDDPDDLLLGNSDAIRQIRTTITAVAPTRATVLLHGETGSGKEAVARALHTAEAAPRPFVAVNCAAIPESMFEAELFGHARGAYTGADRDRTGLIEDADGGTLFLDEVGELPTSTQVKLNCCACWKTRPSRAWAPRAPFR